MNFSSQEKLDFLQVLRHDAHRVIIYECLFFLIVPIFLAIYFAGHFLVTAFVIEDHDRSRYVLLGSLGVGFSLCTVILPILPMLFAIYYLNKQG